MFSGNSWLNSKLHVTESKCDGKGVFARQDIKSGERLAIFGGSIMLIDEIDTLPESVQFYAMQIEERFVLGNRSPIPEDTDYFNHSCDPNSGFNGQIFLVAMRDIAEGEEITFDYAMTISESVGSDTVFDMDCNCGSKNCRKMITEDDWKIEELQKRYEGYFSDYVQKKIEKKSGVDILISVPVNR